MTLEQKLQWVPKIKADLERKSVRVPPLQVMHYDDKSQPPEHFTAYFHKVQSLKGTLEFGYTLNSKDLQDPVPLRQYIRFVEGHEDSPDLVVNAQLRDELVLGIAVFDELYPQTSERGFLKTKDKREAIRYEFLQHRIGVEYNASIVVEACIALL